MLKLLALTFIVIWLFLKFPSEYVTAVAEFADSDEVKGWSNCSCYGVSTWFKFLLTQFLKGLFLQKIE